MFDHMLRIEPNFAIALHNRAIALTDLQRYAEAVASCDRALAIEPDYAEALQSRGVALEYMYRHDLALTNFTRAVELNRNLEYLLGSLVASQLYCHDFQCLEQNRTELTTGSDEKNAWRRPGCSCWLQITLPINSHVRESSRPTNARRGRRSGRVKLIGTTKSDWRNLSFDLRADPTSHLMAGLFEHHDRSQFETIAVSYGPDYRKNFVHV